MSLLDLDWNGPELRSGALAKQNTKRCQERGFGEEPSSPGQAGDF